MTVRARRGLTVGEVLVAILTIKLKMYLVKSNACNGVIKIAGVPSGVTGGTPAVKL